MANPAEVLIIGNEILGVAQESFVRHGVVQFESGGGPVAWGRGIVFGRPRWQCLAATVII